MTIVSNKTIGLARNMLAEAATVPKSQMHGRHATSREDGAPAIAVAADAAEPACPPSPAGRAQATCGHRAESESRSGGTRPREITRVQTGAGQSDGRAVE